jgi:hypothetical protein
VRTDWDARFQAIELCIESKDFDEAKRLIDAAIIEANRVLIDPTFLVRQLRAQKASLS